MTPQPPQQPQPGPTRRYSKLCVAGFAVAVLGVCFAPLALIGLVVAFIGRLQTKRDEHLQGGNLALATVPLFFISLCLSGLGLIALPNFLADRNRLRQGECKTGLKAMLNAAESGFADTSAYSVDEAEKAAPRGGRYTFVLGAGADGAPRVVPGKDGAEPKLVAQALQLVPVGVRGECPACSLTLACVANLDGDEDGDVWSISTAPRWTTYGLGVDPGQPHNDRKDYLENSPEPLTFEDPRDAGVAP